LNLLTINALTAADSVLVPLQCEYYALEGLAQLMRTIDRVQQGLNPRLALEGVLLTMYDQRNKLSELVAEDVRRHFGDKVYKTLIPRNVRVSEAPSHGMPVLMYDPRCAGAEAYTDLAAEILRRNAGTPRERQGAAACGPPQNDPSSGAACRPYSARAARVCCPGRGRRARCRSRRSDRRRFSRGGVLLRPSSTGSCNRSARKGSCSRSWC